MTQISREQHFAQRGPHRVTMYPVAVRWRPSSPPTCVAPPQVREGFAKKLVSVWTQLKAERPSSKWAALLWYGVDDHGYCLVWVQHTPTVWRASALLISRDDFVASGRNPFLFLYAGLLPDPQEESLRAVALTVTELGIRAEQGFAAALDKTSESRHLPTGLLEPLAAGGEQVEIHRSSQQELTSMLVAEWDRMPPEQQERLTVLVAPHTIELNHVGRPRVVAVYDREPPRLDRARPAPASSPQVPARPDLIAAAEEAANLAAADGLPTEAKTSNVGAEPLLSAREEAARSAIRQSLQEMEAKVSLSGERSPRLDVTLEPRPAEQAVALATPRAAVSDANKTAREIPRPPPVTAASPDDADRRAAEAIRASLSSMPSRADEIGELLARPVERLTSDILAMQELARAKGTIDEKSLTSTPSIYSATERHQLVARHIGAINDIGRSEASPSGHLPIAAETEDEATIDPRDDEVYKAWGLRDDHGPLTLVHSLGQADGPGLLARVVAAWRTLRENGDEVNPCAYEIVGTPSDRLYVDSAAEAMLAYRRVPEVRQEDRWEAPGPGLRCRATRNLWSRFAKNGRGIGSGSEGLVLAPRGPLEDWPELLDRAAGLVFLIDAHAITHEPTEIAEQVETMLGEWEEAYGRHTLARLRTACVISDLHVLTDPSHVKLAKAVDVTLKRIAQGRLVQLGRRALDDMDQLGNLAAKGLGATWLKNVCEDRGLRPRFFVVPPDLNLDGIATVELPLLWMLSACHVKLNLGR